MTKENLTSITVILDKSGSMYSLAADTVGSFNTLLEDQKKVEGEAFLTLCTFSGTHTLVHDFVKLTDIPSLDPKSYRPDGNTALLDALGSTINSVGSKLAAMPEDERPSKVIFVVVTDGAENASREFTADQVRAMVKHQQDVYNWEFVFTAANIDAVQGGTSLGFSGRNSVSYNATKGGTKDLYKSISDNMTVYRSSAGHTKGEFFTNQKPTEKPADPVDPADVDDYKGADHD